MALETFFKKWIRLLDIPSSLDRKRQSLPLQKVSSVDLKALAAKNPEHWKKAAAIRALTLDAVAAANSGHSGMAMGMADVATVLFEKHMKFDASAPNWPDRDLHSLCGAWVDAALLTAASDRLRRYDTQ